VESDRLRFHAGTALLLESEELIVRLEAMLDDVQRRAEDEARRREDATRRREDATRRREEETRRREEAEGRAPARGARAPPPLTSARAARLQRLDEDLAVLRAVRRADEAALLHRLDDLRGAVVAEAELALEPAGGAAAGLGDDAHGLVVHAVEL